ncbi:MAG TPA: DNA-binding transcriptional regulator [Verrucomicrobiota bacterium]|nr:DNA-binding transcriptional regulator [Verrucomicrobiota bacterium]
MDRVHPKARGGRRRPPGWVPRVVLLIESSRSSGRSLLRGIANYAHHHGPWAFYWEPRGLEKAWPRIQSLEADGFILRDVKQLENVLSRGLPTVVVGHSKQEIPEIVNVITDSETIGKMAAEHLLSRGFHEFAFCGFDGIPWSELRGESFRRRLVEAGHDAHFYQTTPESAGWQTELNKMARWLKSLPKPVGLMAANDDRGEQVIEACKVAGIRVPDEVAVIGVDNDELVCELSDPPMSSIALNFERAGYESAGVLDLLMRGKVVKGKKILVAATHIVTRRSSDILAVADQHVAAALQFIRDHAREMIGVPDVAKSAGISRRSLEKRFQETLRRSVLSEIRRIRVNQICRMLVETNRPISEIAIALGYTGPEHIARYFRREMGTTPLAYRRKFGQK